jgi:hypothetical protein
MRHAMRPLPRALSLVALAVMVPAVTVADAVNGTWAPITPSSVAPEFRIRFGAVYDPVRERLIVDGGMGAGGGGDCLADTWALSLSGTHAWTQMPYLWASRLWHAAVYDLPRDRMLIFSTWDCDFFGYGNYVYALSLAGTPAWSMLSTAGTPPAGRVRHSMIYDPVRDRMLVFGGDPWGSQFANQVWELTLSGAPTWTQLLPAGALPSGRNLHTAIYDPVRDVMLVFGGSTATGRVNDLWQLTLGGTPTWTAVAAGGTPPAGRSGHSAIYDPVRDRMVIFGGYSSQPTSDVWALSLAGTPTWSQLSPSGTSPLARTGHQAIYDPPRDRMVVYGAQLFPEDLWALEWGPPVGVEPPPPGRSTMSLQARPNPAAADVTVEFALPQPGTISLRVYDVRGRLVRVLFEGEAPAGERHLLWDRRTGRGEPAAPGVYHLRLRSAGKDLTSRFVLVD